VGDPTRGLTDMRVVLNQAFDWFLTVEGVQVEELSLLTERGLEITSLGKDWPLVSLPVEGGKVSVPDIFIL
jgi:hypothetical protein